MPKKTTISIQQQLCELGRTLGFDPQIEAQISTSQSKESTRTTYRPIYDVVWFYPKTLISDERLAKLSKLIKAPLTRDRIPFAVFEVEGSTTSSKNQIGNFVNLYHSSAPFKCMITINGEAKRENDTYRRGHKIARSMTQTFGMRNLLFFDAHQLLESLQIELETTEFDVQPSHFADKRGHGGERASTRRLLHTVLHPFIEEFVIVQDGSLPKKTDRFIGVDLYRESLLSQRADLEQIENQTIESALGLKARKCPEFPELESTKSRPIYVPKIDAELGFYLRGGLIKWLLNLKSILAPEHAMYPLLAGLKEGSSELFLSLLGVEVEAQDNKHALGGLANLKMSSQLGLVMAPQSTQSKLIFLQESLGHSGIYFRSIEIR